MNWHIKIGQYALQMIESVDILKSVELLSDTATITLPATIYNKALEIESKIKRGDAVTIKFGYNDKLVTEFEGFVESIKTDNGSLKINCEDAMFLYRVSLDNKAFKNITVKSLLQYVNSKVSTDFKLSCDYDFTYDSFIIHSATAYDVIKKIQEEARPNIYMKDKTLHVHPKYAEIFGSSVYDFAVNIETDELKYKLASERKFMVEVESKDVKGKVIKVESGTTGGDIIRVSKSGITDKKSLLNLANQLLLEKTYTGYEGSFTSWLIPYVDAGYKAKIKDADYEYKEGTYYVLSVKTVFSVNGGVRTITLGKAL